MMETAAPVARIQSLSVHYPLRRSFLGPRLTVKAVDGVSLELSRGEILGLVGESGCGKSSLGRAMVRLVEPNAGQVEIDGIDFLELEGEPLRRHRSLVQMIFQDPYSSLDPRMTVFDILAEPLTAHGVEARAIPSKVDRVLSLVGLAERDAYRYPHEFSGGQRQRIAIARALILEPKVIIADEPVSSLDVSVQAQILNLLLDIQRELHVSMIFISHNLATVRYLADRVAVMYLGKIVEVAKTADLFSNPQHPYTQALLAAVPLPDPRLERQRNYAPLRGEVPSPIHPPNGCAFHTRCPLAQDRCRTQTPTLFASGVNNHQVSCYVVNP